jgi:hypothetical protein
MELILEKITIPEGANLILGQSHFIKTVEDLYEILVGAAPGIKFGLAFSNSAPRSAGSSAPPPTRWKSSWPKPDRGGASWGWWTACPPKAWKTTPAAPGARIS